MKDMLQVWEAHDHCSCSCCHAANYDPVVGKEFFARVERILYIQIGHQVLSLCPACALKLCQLIEPNNCDTDPEM